MKRFYKQIQDQFEFNSHKNLFCNRINNKLKFTPTTLNFLNSNKEFIQKASHEEKWSLIDFMTQRSTEILYQTNQYFSFSRNDCEELKTIYFQLFHGLKEFSYHPVSYALKQVEENHYTNLKNWLKKTNPFAEKIYKKDEPYITKTILCAEYSPQAQLGILNIDVCNLKEPILDIGCGKNALFVKYLRQMGLDAYGIDRIAFPGSYIAKTNWFEFSLKANSWGSVISNLGFSNQFRHHHLRKDGHPIRYAQKYLEILHSLRLNGTFFYAPDLPFIEHCLDENFFEKQSSSIGDLRYKSTSIRRLK